MRAIGVVVALMLAGCSSGLEPSQSDLKAQWEAQNLPPVHYKTDLLALMRTYLNDPTGVRGASLSLPQRKTVVGEPAERFVACVRYDAKKIGGGYAGLKTGAAVYVSGRLDRMLDTPRIVSELCKDAVYEPFLELEKLTR